MNEFSKAADIDKLNTAQALSEQQDKDKETKQTEVVNSQDAEQLLTVECLIIGYTLNNDQLNTLLFATIVDRKLKFVGHLTADAIPDADRKELQYHVRKYPRNYPVVKCAFDAQWLEPVLMCLVCYKQTTPQNRLIGKQLLELLQDVSQN